MDKPSADDLEAQVANREHVARLRQSVDVWNEWRENNPDIRPDLNGANLRGADLRAADLIGADLIGANLEGANLLCANLTSANLKGANLMGAYLFFADLIDVDLRGANLTGADLISANLKDANLKDANLKDANLFSANLEGTSLEGTIEIHEEIDIKRIEWDNIVSRVEPYCAKIEDVVDLKLNTTTPCYIYAEMDNVVILQQLTTLEVVINSDEINFNVGPTAQKAKIQVLSKENLVIQVVGKTNFAVVEDDMVSVTRPKQGDDPAVLHFNLCSTAVGEGEIWVIVYQHQMPLLTLSLKPTVVESRIQMKALSQSSPSETLEITQTQGHIDAYPEYSGPIHQLRIIEKCNGNQVNYRYEFESPKLVCLRSFESLPITTDRKTYIESLYQEIENRWVNTPEDVEAFSAELRAFGGRLFDELFPIELRTLLWEKHTQIDSIMVLSTEPFIPWEMLHLKPPGSRSLPDETLFLGQLGLVRWSYEGGRFPPETIQIHRDKARYIIPHYSSRRYRLPKAEEEAQLLSQLFQASAIEPHLHPVREALRLGEFDLLHFAGHGSAEHGAAGSAHLLLEGEISTGKYIPEKLSATTVGEFARLKRRPLVVLNACQIGRQGYTLTGIGGFAEAFISAGAGAFIGPLWSVGDQSAQIFTETLYRELTSNKTLAEATIAARRVAKETGEATWLAYAVYGHPELRIQITDEIDQKAEVNDRATN